MEQPGFRREESQAVFASLRAPLRHVDERNQHEAGGGSVLFVLLPPSGSASVPIWALEPCSSNMVSVKNESAKTSGGGTTGVRFRLRRTRGSRLSERR